MEEKRFIMEVVIKEITIFLFVLYLNSVYNLAVSLFVGLPFQFCKMFVWG